MKDIDYNKSFEDIKHIDENGIEFWYARELMPVLQYSNWQNFEKIINKAKISCQNSGISVSEHFIDINKLSKRANNAEVQELKILINFITLDIKAYTMEKLLMILLKEKD